MIGRMTKILAPNIITLYSFPILVSTLSRDSSSGSFCFIWVELSNYFYRWKPHFTYLFSKLISFWQLCFDAFNFHGLLVTHWIPCIMRSVNALLYLLYDVLIYRRHGISLRNPNTIRLAISLISIDRLAFGPYIPIIKSRIERSLVDHYIVSCLIPSLSLSIFSLSFFSLCFFFVSFFFFFVSFFFVSFLSFRQVMLVPSL